MTRRSAVFLVLALALSLFAGCSTDDSPLPVAGRLDGKKHFFVHANLNDNHGIAEQIAGALKIRGAQAETAKPRRGIRLAACPCPEARRARPRFVGGWRRR